MYKQSKSQRNTRWWDDIQKYAGVQWMISTWCEQKEINRMILEDLCSTVAGCFFKNVFLIIFILICGMFRSHRSVKITLHCMISFFFTILS